MLHQLITSMMPLLLCGTSTLDLHPIDLRLSANVSCGLPAYSSIMHLVDCHEFYVGLTDIVYNAETMRYEITIKVFTDDLELALQDSFDQKIKLDEKPEEAHDALIFRYVDSKFAVKAKNQQALKLTHIGRETELDVTWIYLESTVVQPLQTVLVSNAMMMELYEDQSHIVHINQGGKVRSTLLHRNRTSDTIKL